MEWCLAAVALFALISGLLSWAAEPSADPDTHRVVRVGEDDTLWSIARDNMLPSMSTAQTAYVIRTLNELPDSSVSVGSVLVVPVPAADGELLASR